MTHLYAVAVGGVLAVVIGLGFHLLDRRRIEAILRRELDQANARADALEEELAVTRLNLADADEALAEYREVIGSFPQRMLRAYDAGLAAMLERHTGLHAAESWTVPPEKWAPLQEARENPEAN